MVVGVLCVWFGLGLSLYVVCWVYGFVWYMVVARCKQNLRGCKYEGLMGQT
jgi:hypothetical protein